MEAYNSPVSVKGLGITSVCLGLLGGMFYWWTPLGMVMSLAGLLSGFIGLTYARRHTTGFGVLIAGVLLCALALILDFVIAGYGLELVKFQSLS